VRRRGRRKCNRITTAERVTDRFTDADAEPVTDFVARADSGTYAGSDADKDAGPDTVAGNLSRYCSSVQA
jgi:hypothetical protein